MRRGRAAIGSYGRIVAGYIVAIVLTVATVYLRARLGLALTDRPLLVLYVIPILVSAYIGGLGPGLVATAVAVVATRYLWLGTMSLLPIDIVQWMLLIANGVLASLLSEALHRARRRAEDNQRIQQQIASTAPGVIHAYHHRANGPGYATYVSPSVETVFGISEKQWLEESEPLFTLIHPEDRPLARASIAEAGRNLVPWRATFRVRHPRKGEIWVEGHSIPERATDGGILWFGFYHDVTEVKRLDERLRQTQKAEAIGHLTGGVAHDFNNLLGVISGNLELLSEAIAQRPDLRELAQSAIAAVDRGAVLTRSLLAFARQQPLHPVATDVDRLIQDLLPMLSRTLGETIHIAFRPMTAPPICEVDPGQLQSAIINLALNSRDAMPEGGELTIATSRLDITSEAARQAEIAPGRYIVLAVTDNGSGMTADIAAKAFDPFFTTKGLAGGSGLGLSMVYGFVKQSRGHVTIDSAPDEGTTVKLYLPRRLGSDRVANEPAAASNPTGREKILVVEDDKAMSRLTCRLLMAMGYTTAEAATGVEALDILARDRDIALVLTDVVLPGGMKGPQLVAAAAAQRDDLKFLYMSGYTDNAIAQRGNIPEGVKLLQKPFRRSELGDAVRAALDTPAVINAGPF